MPLVTYENHPYIAAYYEWLVGLLQRNDASYRKLLEILMRLPYQFKLTRDKNRAMDGLDLREDYLRIHNLSGAYKYPPFLGGVSCTVLEMMYALARRMDFQVPGDPSDEDEVIGSAIWFWEMIENLELDRFTDESFSEDDKDEIAEVVEAVIVRATNGEVNYDGQHGFFPIVNHNDIDMRPMELWYQASEYLKEASESD